MEKNIDYGNKLKQIRTYFKLNQSDFAKKLGIKQAYYSLIENGKKKPSVHILDKIFDMGISGSWWFNDIGDIEVAKDFEDTATKDSELIKINESVLEKYFRGSKLRYYHYEYLQIKYYEQFSMDKLKELVRSELSDLESIYNSYSKIIETLHFLGMPEFLCQKFPKLISFDSEKKEFDEDFNEDINNIILSDDKLKTILYILRIKENEEYYIYKFNKLSYYINLYKTDIKDFIMDFKANIDSE